MSERSLAEEVALEEKAPDEVEEALSPIAAPRAPTEAAWAAMSEAERQRVLDALPGGALPHEIGLTGEGDWHFDAKSEALDTLRRYFDSLGRRIYLAAERRVYYPGARSFIPDLLAVLDVDPKRRSKWVVSAEGKGIDLALEILHFGDRKKDLEDNVAFYASLGIPEYFVYDCGQQQLFGYRLPRAGAERYEPILPRFGQYGSAVLGLSLCIVGDQLRFFHGTAELAAARSLIPRLELLVTEIQQKRQQAEAERQQAEAERQQALAALQQGVLLLLSTRGLVVPEAVGERILRCESAAELQRLLTRAATCASADELLSG